MLPEAIESEADSDDSEWQQVRADNHRSGSRAALSGESPIHRRLGGTGF